MKTIKVAEATNIQLDWLVATLLYSDDFDRDRVFLHSTGQPNAKPYVRIANQDKCEVHLSHVWSPTTDQSQGGQIIERERISLMANCFSGEDWAAFYYNGGSLISGVRARQRGATPLIAAMRCYVTSKLGETAEVPEELV